MIAPSRAARQSISAFRHRNYRLFFTGQAISLIGTWMQQVAQAWLVLQLGGGDPFWLGVVAAAQFIPVMILGLFAGVLADVLPKRQTLMAVQAVMMVLALVLAILSASGLVEIWIVVVLAVLLGCANAVDMPVRQAFSIEMVGPKDIGNAVSLNSAMFNGARVIGPAVAGLTIGAFGVTAAFAINAASFLAVIVGLAMMRDDELNRAPLMPRPRSAGEVVVNLREGLTFVRRTPIVLMAVTVVGVVATVAMNFSVLIPPLAKEGLHSDAAGYGFLMTASGIGALAAAIALIVAGRPQPGRIAVGALALGIASVALAAAGSFGIALLLMIFVGAGGITMAATANATIQLSVPEGLRGRVMGVYTTVFAGSTPVGGLAMGALASGIGIEAAIAIGGVLAVITGAIALVWWGRIRPSWTGMPPRPLVAAAPAAATSGPASSGALAAGPRDLAPRELAQVEPGRRLDGQPATRIR